MACAATVVAALLRRLAPREQLVEQPRQDRRLAAKGPVGRADEIEIRRRRRHVTHGVDVEGADDARVQALEIEHPDVAVQARFGLEHVAALLRDMHARVAAPHARGDEVDALELGQIEEVEGGDARRDAVRGHARELAAGEGELDEAQFLRDAEGESGIRARIQREGRQIVLVVVDDFRQAVTRRRAHRLAFAEHFARDRIERIVIHADERAAQQVDAVEHQTARDARLAAAEIALGFADSRRPRASTELERVAHTGRNPLEHAEIEIDEIPTGEHVRIERSHPGGERLERVGLGRAAHGTLGARPVVWIDDEHLIAPQAVQRYRQETLRLRIGLDVERQHARRDLDVGRAQIRILEHQTVGAGCGDSLDFTAALDAALDQVARGEAHVGFEGVDICRVKLVPQRRHVRGHGDIDAAHGAAVEGALLDRLGRRQRLEDGCPRHIGGAHIEVRPLPIVPHQKSAAALQTTVQVHHRRAATVRSGGDTVSCLQNEAACLGHAVIVPQVAN